VTESMPFGSLWLPVLVSAVLTWIASAIVWMALPHHKSDFSKLPSEDGVTDALGKLKLAPGQYLLPYMSDMKQMKDPAYIKRLEAGPLAMIRIRENGVPKMGPNLAAYFLYCFLVSFVTGYIARHTMHPGESFHQVFRMTGAVAIAAYTMATIPESIWMWRPWNVTLKNVCDSIVYGLITAAVFAALWPKG
jgi:hypothetical protein